MLLKFPIPGESETVVTPIITQTLNRLLAVHKRRGQMAVITGKSGAGKSTAAEHIEDEVSAGFKAGVEDAFDAKYYVATDMLNSSGDLLQRRFLAEFATQVLNLVVPKDLRTIDVPSLMKAIALGLRLSNVQLVFIDEAGHIPPAGLDHLATLINTVTTAEKHPLTVALVGMHDLPTNVLSLPQVARRVAEFIYFEPYDELTALMVLRTVHDYFVTLDVATAEGRDVMEFLLSQEVSEGGLIGLIVPLVERAVVAAKHMNLPFGLRALRVAHSIKNVDATRGRADMKRRWAGGDK
jgi:hypothetical protein